MRKIFKKYKIKKIYIGISMLSLLIFGLSYQSYSSNKYKIKENKTTQVIDNRSIAYTLNGETTDKTYEWLLTNKAVDSVTCEKGTVATWNYERNSLNLSSVIIPDYCTIDFKDGYTVTLTATNGAITSSASASIGYNGTLNFDVTPNDGYQLEGSTVSCTGSATGTTTTTGVQISNIKETQTCTVTLKSIVPTLYEKILADNPTVSTRSSFSSTNVANTTGTIYSTTATEDGSIVYYYSGNTTNNWVQFGGFYWRIIRTNEDGSVRMLYVGTRPDTTSGYVGTSAFNSTYTNSMYVGYMYGADGTITKNRANTNSSTIKTYIDNWYQSNILTNYDKYISKTAIYCNDRSVGNGTYNTGSTPFYFGAYARLFSNKTPTYRCGGNTTGGLFESTQAVEDKFSASTSGGGNGKLRYPIALMTADEVAYAGGIYGTRLSSPYAWYYTNSAGNSTTGSTNWWTMAPSNWSGSSSLVLGTYGSSNPGRLFDFSVNSSLGVRPSISLKSCVNWVSGNGTPSNPYIVSVDTACTNAEN